MSLPLGVGLGMVGVGIFLIGGSAYLLMKKENGKVSPEKEDETEDQKDPAPNKHLEADLVFDRVTSNAKASTVSLQALSTYLVDEGVVPLDKAQGIFSQLDTNGDGSVDRDEWRVGFAKGLISPRA